MTEFSALGHSSKNHPHRTIWVRWNNKRGISLADDPQMGMYEPWRRLNGGYKDFFEYVSSLPRFFKNDRHDLELDRVRDVQGNMHGYAPGWIRWADDTEQNNNRKSVRRLANGTPLHIEAKRNGVKPKTALARIKAGYSFEDAVKGPLGMKLLHETLAKDELLNYWVSTGCIKYADDGRMIDTFTFAPILCRQDSEGYFFGLVPKWVKRGFSEKFNRTVTKKKLHFRAHRLLGIIWFGQPNATILSIDHINGNPADNSRSNLRGWTTPAEQSQYAYQRGSRVEPIPRLEYNKPESYQDMLIPAPKLPRRTLKPIAANFSLAIEVATKFRDQLLQSCLSKADMLSILLLAAPGNEVRVEANNTLTILVQNLNTKEILRVRFAREGAGVRQILYRDKVFLACPKCKYETGDGRPEIADRLAGVRNHQSQCKVCASVGIFSPAIARLLMHDPRTGEASAHPLLIPASTRGTYAWLRCSIDGCRNFAGSGGPMAIKQCVARAATDSLPVCESHRKRTDNFKMNHVHGVSRT